MTSVRSLTTKEKKVILDLHNKIRSMTAAGEYHGQPKASDMLLMRYDEDIAKYAQKHADACSKERYGHHLGMGQNVAYLHETKGLSSTVNSWGAESKLFKWNTTNKWTKAQAQYTQLVWATTDRVGCGYNYCSHAWKSRLVCNYKAPGNSYKGFVYTVGEPCSNCPKNFTCVNGTLCQSLHYVEGFFSSSNSNFICLSLFVALVLGSVSEFYVSLPYSLLYLV